MSKANEVRCYDYVNYPYAQVRDALKKDALAIFQSATKAASSRAESIASELRVDLSGIAVGTDVIIEVKNIEEPSSEASGPVIRLQLEWQAAKMPGLFPLMKGELAVYPLTRSETQLDFSGIYEPPFGVVGKAMNAVAGHRIAEVSVHGFVTDVATYLRHTLAK